MALAFNAVLSVPDEGLLTVGEFLTQHKFDREGEFSFNSPPYPGICAVNQGPECVTDVKVYKAPLFEIKTEEGLYLEASGTTRILVLPSTGIAKWVQVSQLKPGYVVFNGVGNNVEGNSQFFQTTAHARLWGACACWESRHGKPVFCTLNSVQRNLLRFWAEEVFQQPIFVELDSYAKFTGLVEPANAFWADLVGRAVLPDTLAQVRKSSLDRQAAWLAGVSLTKGYWSFDDFEIELEHKEVAETFQWVAANLGVRFGRYVTLNTFGSKRWKLYLKGDSDFKKCCEIIWEGYDLPKVWDIGKPMKVYVHPNITETLNLANRILTRYSQKPCDVSNYERDNFVLVARHIRRFCKTRMETRIWETLVLAGNEIIQTDSVTGVAQWSPSLVAGFKVTGSQIVANNALVASY